MKLSIYAPSPGVTSVPCSYCDAGIDVDCRTASGGVPRNGVHSDRFRAYSRARKFRQMWFAMLNDEPRFGLNAGDIVRCVNYPYDPYDPKVTVLFREEDGFDPECNQYLSDVAFLGFVPRDMEGSS